MEKIMRPVWAEIDLDKAAYSVDKINIGNSYGNEKTYIKYTINLEK